MGKIFMHPSPLYPANVQKICTKTTPGSRFFFFFNKLFLNLLIFSFFYDYQMYYSCTHRIEQALTVAQPPKTELSTVSPVTVLT